VLSGSVEPLAEPFTRYWPLDVWRVAIAAAALWLAVLVTRLCVARWRDARAGKRDRRTHPAVYMSYALCLWAIGGYRIAAIGQPMDSRLIVTTVIVILAIYGLAKRLKFSMQPPHRREPPPGH
jgi:hypothetical protein